MTYTRDGKYIDENWLRQRYGYECATPKELAEEIGCTVTIIRNNLSKYGITRVVKPNFPVWNKGLNKDNDSRMAKLSNDRKGDGNPMYGKKAWNTGLDITDERVAKMAEYHRGVPLTEEHKEKLRQAKLGLRGEQTNHWKGAIPFEMVNGYMSASKQYIHRVIAEASVGRKLRRNEHVHHLDGNKKNNEPSNLIILSSSSHSKLHKAIRNGEVGYECGEGQKKWLSMNDMSFTEVFDEDNRV